MAARKKTTDSAEVSEVLTDEELKAAAEPEEASTKEGEPHKRTVVVAEDESVNRMDLVAMLEDNGYEVVGEAGERAAHRDVGGAPGLRCGHADTLVSRGRRRIGAVPGRPPGRPWVRDAPRGQK